MPTVAETIRETTKDHLTLYNGLLFAQCVTAVGWIGGTVPELSEAEGIVELSMSDVAGAGIAVGAALSGCRPIYVIRYQGFMWYNAAPILNYAAKSKEMWNEPCPIFVRCIASDGAGPVAAGAHHGLVIRMPGISVYAPMTPREWLGGWEYFIRHDEPVYASEHRNSFKIDYEMYDIIRPNARLTLFAISATRLNAVKAAKILHCDLFHIVWLKPFIVTDLMLDSLRKTGRGLVLDCDYDMTAKALAHELMMRSGSPVDVLALEERTGGFADDLKNDGPSVDQIVEAALFGKEGQ